MIDNQSRDLRQLAAKFKELIRVGKVTSRDAGSYTVRVTFAERDNMVSYNLQVLADKTHRDKHAHLPDIGEHVLCLFMPVGAEAGFVLGAVYSSSDDTPTSSGDVDHVTYSDGTMIEYDREASRLTVDCVGEIVVNNANAITITSGGNVSLTCPQLDVDCPQTTFTGAVAVQGGMSVTGGSGAQATITGDVRVAGKLTGDGDITAGGVSVRTHNHKGEVPGNV
jgi:phage baseplate assembly protein V